MRIAIRYGGPNDLERQVQAAVEAEQEGFDGFSYGGAFGPDPMMVIALAGQRTSRIELSTSVMPTYLRHPTLMARQAATAQAATGGRFVLGLGLSHQPVVEGMWGLSFRRPVAHMREYLSVLRPLLEEGRVAFSGEFFRVNLGLQVPGVKPCPILIAALGPAMLRLAGEMADGTITWMVGRKTLESHIVPRIEAAARAAGRPKPRIVVGQHIAVTDDPASARSQAEAMLQMYRPLPSYQRMLGLEGASGPAEVAILGNEEQVEGELRALAAAGATDFLAQILPVGDNPRATIARTRALLKGLIGKI